MCHILIYVPSLTWNVCISDPRVSSAFYSIVRDTLNKNESPVIVIATTSSPRLVNADILAGFLHQFTIEVNWSWKNWIVTFLWFTKIDIDILRIFPTGARWGGKTTNDKTAARRLPVRFKYQYPIHCTKNCGKLEDHVDLNKTSSENNHVHVFLGIFDFVGFCTGWPGYIAFTCKTDGFHRAVKGWWVRLDPFLVKMLKM